MSIEVHHVKANQAKGIQLSQAAVTHFLSHLEQQENAVGVRLYLKKSGCSGLSYELEYVTRAQESDLVFPLSDPYQLYVDKGSYPMIQGTKIDYIKEGLNLKLVFDNPNQTGQCGCGESFTIDEVE